MIKYDDFSKLEKLKRVGKELLNRYENASTPLEPSEHWFAGVSDVLKQILPSDSSLLSELNKIQENASSFGVETVQKTIRSVLKIVEYAEMSLSEPIEATIEHQVRQLESKRKEIEREINNNIMSQFFSSWQFRIPTIILSLAIIFAITGGIQIGQQALNVKDITENALETARQDILSQTEVINSSVNALAETEKNRIIDSVTVHIENLKDEKVPEADSIISDLSNRLDSMAVSVDELETRSEPILAAAQAINNSSPNLIDQAGLLLTMRGWAALTVMAICLISIVIAVIALRRTAR
ncbi:hypothetical protein [Candidatus Leptofilum sp.]|uniref:hypothetical protein n=1 Tax=Candidatus Leptofilum sp. TaxID=3241576 RepID=UPI003B58FCBF